VWILYFFAIFLQLLQVYFPNLYVFFSPIYVITFTTVLFILTAAIFANQFIKLLFVAGLSFIFQYLSDEILNFIKKLC